jgi:hypothetical protein
MNKKIKVRKRKKNKKEYLINIEKIKGIYCGVFFYRKLKSGLVP